MLLDRQELPERGARSCFGRGKKRIFYGWCVVGAGCAMQFVESMLFLQSFGAYFAVLHDDRGWSKTELSGAAAMHQVEAAILGPLLGWFIDRFGPQWVIRAGAADAHLPLNSRSWPK